MGFDIKVFVETLSKAKSLNPSQRRDLTRAARAASGEDLIGEIKPGDVFKSTRGVRLVIQKGERYSLIQLASFDDQYAERDGLSVGRPDMDYDSLEAYMESREYVRVGRVCSTNIFKISQ